MRGTLLRAPLRSYAGIAPIYDALGSIYSGGAIPRCKRIAAEEVANERVLVAGGGTGFEAAIAASLNAKVTLIDLSASMVRQAQRRLRGVQGRFPVEVICGDILEHDRRSYYDTVIANFFLNVFSESQVQQVLRHLLSLVRINGRVIIGDFAPSSGSKLHRLTQAAYHGLPMLTFSALTGSALHEIYDYGVIAESCGATVSKQRDFRLVGIGPRWYRVVEVRR